MIGFLAAASALLIQATSDPLPLIVIQPESIVQVICFAPGAVTAGTAFRIGPTGLLLSVNHVTSTKAQCYIAGKPINLAYKSPTADFSELQGDDGPYLDIDCGGFVKGRKYIALGYGRGLKTLTEVELIGTGQHSNGEATLMGVFSVVPGQSGGPIIDEQTGKVVGTVNMENYEEGLSWSVELKNTPVCKKGAVA